MARILAAMTKAIAQVRAHALELPADALRSAIVCGCALALIVAGFAPTL